MNKEIKFDIDAHRDHPFIRLCDGRGTWDIKDMVKVPKVFALFMALYHSSCKSRYFGGHNSELKFVKEVHRRIL